jgi:hypothetical protein
LGEATLRNRVKSHPDVGERWYTDILAEIRAEQERERRKAAAPPTPPEEKDAVVNERKEVEAH